MIFKPSKNTRLSVSKNLTVSTFGSAHPRHHEQKVQTITWKSPDPAPEFLMQATSTFINLYLPASAQGPTPSGQSPASWVYVLPNFTHQNSAYKKCLTVLCVAQLGTWNHDSVLEHESTRLYASALAELRTTIQSGKIKDPEATLASVVMLSTYEVCSCLLFGRWIREVRALADPKIGNGRHSWAHRKAITPGPLTFEVVRRSCSFLDGGSMKVPLVANSFLGYVRYV